MAKKKKRKKKEKEKEKERLVYEKFTLSEQFKQIPGSSQTALIKLDIIHLKRGGLVLLPVHGYGKIILPFNADVWVPLVQSLRVLLKHPLVPSGNAARRQKHCEIDIHLNKKISEI